MVDVRVERLSDSIDIIPLMVSERLIDVNGDYKGMYIVVNGQFRSYNRHEERKNKLVLSVLQERSTLWMKLVKIRNPIRSIWTDIFARNRFTGRRRWEGKLPICCWQSTGLWQVGLYTVYLLGQKCQVCQQF